MDLVVVDAQYESLPNRPGSAAKFYTNNGLGSFTLQNTIAHVGSYSYGGAAPPPKVIGANNSKMYIGDISGSPADWSFIGRLAGAGKTEKPYVKAGNKMKAMRAKNKLYPRTSGVAMNAADHPYGGTHRRTKGRPLQSGRSTPPGRKVGSVAPKRTGRRKK